MRSESPESANAHGSRTLPAGVSNRTAVNLPGRLLGEALVVAAVLGWWVLSRSMPDYIIPSPWQVAVGVYELFFDPDKAAHTLISTLRVIGSVIVSTLIGALLALLPRWFEWIDVTVHERIQPFLSSFPSVGWAILAVIWFGNSTSSVMFVQVAILVPFCLVNVAEGLRALDRELIEMGRSFSRNRRRVFFKLTLPLLLPYVVAAVRIAYGVGWKIALVSELFGADRGLGYLMLEAQIISDAATVFATCLAIVLIFIAGERLIINPLARLVEHR